jgi:hypothetical protein
MSKNKTPSNKGGRPKGSRNRIQRDVIEAFAEHWAKHGADAIDTVYRERPADYLRFAGNFLPKETIMQEFKPEQEMSDEEFQEALSKVRNLRVVPGGKE